MPPKQVQSAPTAPTVVTPPPVGQALAVAQSAVTSAGGLSRSRRLVTLPPGTVEVDYEDAGSVCRLLAAVTTWILQGQIDPTTAKVAIAAAAVALQALEQSAIEDEMARLRAVVVRMDAKRWSG